jgi:hypothetical protein
MVTGARQPAHLIVPRAGVIEGSLLLLLLPPASAAAEDARAPADAMRVLRTSVALPWLALPPAAVLLHDSGLAGGARGLLAPAKGCFGAATGAAVARVTALLARAREAAVWLL